MMNRIDFAAVRDSVNLRQIIEADLGPPLRGGRWACPSHQGDAPNFGVDDERQLAHCFVCDWTIDAFGWIQFRHNVSVVEAARILAPNLATLEPTPGTGPRPYVPPTQNRRPPERPRMPQAWSDAEWQSEVDSIVTDAQARLWGSEGAGALEWLRCRGLADSTIRGMRLGWNPQDYRTRVIAALGPNDKGQPRGFWVPRGVTIPWPHPEAAFDPHEPHAIRWVGCNVRRLSATFGNPENSAKYFALTKSERGHAYPFAYVSPGLPLLVAEGEFDAMLAGQIVGHRVNVTTAGGAKNRLMPDVEALLDSSPVWLLAHDHDASGTGDEGARRLMERDRARSRRIWFSNANDLTDFVTSGGDLEQLLAVEFERFGWSWPPVPIVSRSREWRARAARLPHDLWKRWRDLALEIQRTYGPSPSGDEIDAAHRQAFHELLASLRQGRAA